MKAKKLLVLTLVTMLILSTFAYGAGAAASIPTASPSPTPTLTATRTPISGIMIQKGCALHSDYDHITFPTAFTAAPVIVTSAQYGWDPKIACAVDNAATGFDLALRDHDGNSVATAWVQWIAVGSGTPDPNLMVERECALHGNGDHITFAHSFTTDPVIVNSAQYSWDPKIACAVDNAATGFDLALEDHSGNSVATAWVQTIAVGNGTPDPNLMVETGCALYGNGDHITFAHPFTTAPVIVTSAQYSWDPKIACAVNNAATGFDLALRDHDGNSVATAWVQWIAVGPDTTPPSVTITPLTPDPTSDNTPTFTGTATDTSTNISSVEYKVDAGSWTAATASDGAFDSLSENYTFTTSELSDGAHTVYVRATDAATNTTAEANYASDDFTVDTTAPSVTSTSPVADATDVAVDTVIAATFNEAMDESTITTSSFTLDSVSGSVSYNSGTYTATFTPSADLSYSTTYAATLSTTITDAAGNPLASAYSWSFTTAISSEEEVTKGDFDGDGDIDLADFVEFAAAYGSSSGDTNYNAIGDFDDSGDIGLADFVEFAAAYGA